MRESVSKQWTHEDTLDARLRPKAWHLEFVLLQESSYGIPKGNRKVGSRIETVSLFESISTKGLVKHLTGIASRM